MPPTYVALKIVTLSTGSRLYGVHRPCAETVAVSLALAMKATVDIEKQNKKGPCVNPFLTGRVFLREPSWKYSSKLYSGSKKLRSACSGNIRPIGRSLPLIG